jgi:hypothetical protein
MRNYLFIFFSKLCLVSPRTIVERLMRVFPLNIWGPGHAYPRDSDIQWLFV